MLPSRRAERSAVLLVLTCTFLGAAAQILMKSGGNALAGIPASHILGNPTLLLRNAPLFAGYCLYAMSAALLVLALRRGELSILYPIISLTYVWVLLLSGLVFHETLNFWKIGGVISIVAGVGMLGRDGSS